MYVPPLFFHRLRQFIAGRFPTLSILRQFFATGLPKCVARRGSAQSIPAASEAHPISTFALLGGGNCPVRKIPSGVRAEEMICAASVACLDSI